jgi:integrase
VQAVDTAAVMRVLEQDVDGTAFWVARLETASRVRQRIEAVLDWAKVHGYREAGNPARWRGQLDKLLPAKSKVRVPRHHAALPHREVPAFMTVLRAQEGTAARAFEFAILTCARTSEALSATWAEVNLDGQAWTIAASRMKSSREHRVPLSSRALAILKEMRLLAPGSGADAFIFPGAKHGRPLSNMAFLTLLRRMGRGDLTAHGMRASFKTWASEETPFPRDVIERALAHVTGNRAERAYERGDLFKKRRALMEAWAAFCGSAETGDNVH